MFVIKRDGSREKILFDKITERLRELSKDLSDVDCALVTQKVNSSLTSGLHVSEIDEIAACISASLITTNIQYETLASRLSISNLHKQTPKKFSEFISFCSQKENFSTKKPIIPFYINEFVQRNKEVLDKAIDNEKDYNLNFFGFHTLKKSYLIKVKEKTIERYQYLLMRVSIGINLLPPLKHFNIQEEIKNSNINNDNNNENKNKEDKGCEEDSSNIKEISSKIYSQYKTSYPSLPSLNIKFTQNKSSKEITKEEEENKILKNILQTYNLLSSQLYTHASPTLFNAATFHPQLASCFLLDIRADSLQGIFETLSDCAAISKHSGGLGVSVSKIRSRGSYIAGTNGRSSGIVPMLCVYNACIRYVEQGAGKRKGSIAVYLEPWHADVLDFLPLRKNTGAEERRCRDLFLALWVPDLFMKRVAEDGDWFLMNPSVSLGLNEVWGKDFEELYNSYISKGMFIKKVKARFLMKEIARVQIETGMPYMLYKDRCNEMSNQKNLGTIKSSNLCAEIIEYTDEGSVAVCNLASISLKAFVKPFSNKEVGFQLQSYDIIGDENYGEGKGFFTMLMEEKQPSSYTEFYDFEKLHQITKQVVYNLNKVIDFSYYPNYNTKKTNFLHRPIGIGVQGLQEVFLYFRLAFDSKQARELNVRIFERIYFAALEASNELAGKFGSYPSFKVLLIRREFFILNLLLILLLIKGQKRTKKGKKK